MTNEKNPLIGQRVVKVWLAADKEAIKFDVEDGEPIIARCDADCCSFTWIEGIDAPESMVGTVAAVEGLEMPDLGDMPECDVVAYYGCRITTERGSCVIDYRNDSNGYYGGDLIWPHEDFYGGVYGQNQSKEEWKLLAPKETPE